MNERQLLNLLNKFHSDTCTAEELVQLNEWFHQVESDEQHWLLPEDLKVSLTQEMYHEFRQQLQNTNAGKQKMPKKRRINSFTAIAATALLFIGAALYLYLNYQVTENKKLAQTKIHHDVPPGHNGAILTLSDGRKVTLDSANNTQIVNQGNTQIISTNGQLAYKAAGAPSEQTAYNTLSTPRARQYKIVLPDGTKVWLNAESSIRYPVAFNSKTREVSVTGETYFEVAHNAAQPFSVKVKGLTIEDIGTHFNISAYDDETSVKSTLVEGSISITKAATKVVLKPGQQAVTGATTNDIKVNNVNTENITAWTHGFLLMDNNSVREFMNSLSRWYNIDVAYEGKIPEGNFSGMLNSNANLSDILSALEAGGIHTKFDGKKIIVLSH